MASFGNTRDFRVNIPSRNHLQLSDDDDEFTSAPNPNRNAPTTDTPLLSPAVEYPKRNRLQRLSQQLHLEESGEEIVKNWDKFNRKGKKNIGVKESLLAIATSSWLNIMLVLVPLSWVSRFLEWPHRVTFTLSFLAIVPLERLFDYGGDQMAFYLGKDLGGLLMVTLNNMVEATLAIILLTKCELQLLRSTIVGVVILHLLLVPGTAFVTGGARIVQQDLHQHSTELNHSLLTLGVLSLLLPAAFFAALDSPLTTSGSTAATQSILTDELRGIILQMSRGIAVLLLIVYVCSRIYLHNPPGKTTTIDLENHLKDEHDVNDKRQGLQVNQWVCIIMLVICIGLMAATAEWLVESIDIVREVSKIQLEWFGLILLPIVSFAADGFVAAAYFFRWMIRHLFLFEYTPPATLARAQAIDLSIQFTLFWMPLFVLLGWWTHRPLTLLFDLFEVVVIMGACFIVNYVTADSKTNWAEGVAMISFYCMIALCAWFYTGQPEIKFLAQCESVAAALEAVAATAAE